MIYLDNAATTYPKPEEVYEKMDMLTREMSVNAGRGSYELARKATDVINGTRAKLADFFGAEDVNLSKASWPFHAFVTDAPSF